MRYSERRFAARLNSFHPRGAAGSFLLDAIRAVGRVPGLTALELNYPQHFAGETPESVFAAAADAGLAVTALNLRFDGPDFVAGAFTHPEPANRERAIVTAIEAVDLASLNGIDHVILWMGPDGFDYPFQVDYGAIWDMEITGFRRVATRNPNIRVSVEYKPSDPRRVSLVRSMADALLAAREVDLPNFGVTIDFCHSLMAGEQPAAAAALALRAGRLFGVHLNDGYGQLDDGMMVGLVHPWHLLELLLELRNGHYEGTLYFDTFPTGINPAGECAANIETVNRMERLLDRVSADELGRIRDAQDALGAAKLVQEIMLGTSGV